MAERIVFVSIKIGHNAPGSAFPVEFTGNIISVGKFKKAVKTELLSDLNGIDAYHLEVSSLQSISRFHIMHHASHRPHFHLYRFIVVSATWIFAPPRNQSNGLSIRLMNCLRVSASSSKHPLHRCWWWWNGCFDEEALTRRQFISRIKRLLLCFDLW